jgi:4-hydroxythreonine-4-phosphate dehydrogenase
MKPSLTSSSDNNDNNTCPATLRLAVTSGEPAGIGPDLSIQLAQQERQSEIVVLADSELLTDRAAQLKLPLQIRPYQGDAPPQSDPAGQLCVCHVPLNTPCEAGVLNPQNSSYVTALLNKALTGCQSGEFSAMVTAPVHKAVINESGIAFSGHTEYLADKTGTNKVVMLLATPQLRVALATTHIPLSKVANSISSDSLAEILHIMNRELGEKFDINSPRIAVCGLNPHAGESGHLGREEIDIIIPCLDRLREEGLNLAGPLPADTAFTPHALAGVDAVLAMYHDQGLPVLKSQGFGRAVNITLGLPFIRTSVDHGTALELAGTGQAESGSLRYAIEVAGQMARQTVRRDKRR